MRSSLDLYIQTYQASEITSEFADLARAAEDSTAIRGATMRTPMIRRRLAGV
jgi:hypothetical protein